MLGYSELLNKRPPTMAAFLSSLRRRSSPSLSDATSLFTRRLPSSSPPYWAATHKTVSHRCSNSGSASSPKRGKWKIRLLLGLVGAEAVAVCFYGKVETVPYSGRRQLLFPTNTSPVQNQDSYFERRKKKCTVFPEQHKFSCRAKTVADRILRAMEEEMEEGGSLSGSKQYLKELKWEVLVVRDAKLLNNACCFDGGKIMICNSHFSRFRKDDEIATIIAHEIGHCIARHIPECFAVGLLMLCLDLLVSAVMPWKLSFWFTIFAYFALWLPVSRKREKEADYIGLLLMAQAGYNPRLAPSVYKHLSTTNKKWIAYLSTHPTGKARAEMLSEEHVMAQAMKIYEIKKPVFWYSKIFKFFC